MAFDFYQEYKNYSTIELLKIMRRPDNYQSDAIAKAAQLLAERQVTPDEIQFVEDYYRSLDENSRLQQKKIGDYKTTAADFLQPLVHPTEVVEPQKWLNILLLVVALEYLWDLFGMVKQLLKFFTCDYCHPDIVFFIDNLSLLFVPFIFFLLYKRKRWGWILLFADNLAAMLLLIAQSYIFFKFQDIHHGSTASFLFSILISAAFVFFLWRDSIAGHFNISHETKKTTAIVTAILTVLYIIVLTLLF